MNGIIRIFHKDLTEFLHGPRALLLILIAPCILLLVVGQLQTQSPPLSMLITGVPATIEEQEESGILPVLEILSEIALVNLTTQTELHHNPHSLLSNGPYDLLLQIEQPDNPSNWRLYSALTDAQQRSFIDTFINLGWLTEGGKALPIIDREFGSEMENSGEILAVFLNLFNYYPAPQQGSSWQLPQTIAFIVCLLPFLVASPSLAREKEAHTLHILLAAPGITPFKLFIGKCMLPITITLCNFVVMLILVESLYDIHIKVDALWILVYLIPALLSSTFIGLFISSIAENQSQTLMASGIYFLVLLLLSGFLYPVTASTELIQYISMSSPLTYLRPTLDAWMLGADISTLPNEAFHWMSIQAIVYGIISVLAFRYTLRKL